MSNRIHLTTALLSLTLAAAAPATAGSFKKSYDWGNSNFGVDITGEASGQLNGSKISMDAEGKFKARLFGGSKTAKAVFDATHSDSTRKMKAELIIDGIVLSTKNQSFSSTITVPLVSRDLFKKSKQFTLWGVPVVVIASVSADASIGYGLGVDINDSIGNAYEWETELRVFGSVGASGTITAGPGTELAGVGVYGSITIGEISLAAVKTSPFFGIGQEFEELQLDLEIGTFEAGVTAWVGGASVSASVLEIEGFVKNLKTIKL